MAVGSNHAAERRASAGNRILAGLGLVIVLVAAALPIALPAARRSVLPSMLVLALALPLIGLQTALQGAAALRDVVLRHKAIWAAAIVLLLALPLLAGSYVPIYGYLNSLAFSTFGFLVVLGLAARFDAEATALTDSLRAYKFVTLALIFIACTSAAALFVLDNVPHVSDEVAYQFQARALASGQLFVEPPQDFAFFDFVHTIRDGAKWYGIMNPGWPGILALGYAVRTPWLVNPILGALTLFVLFSFYRKSGYNDREARIAVLLLALSPLLLFMSSTYMAHTANLLLFAVFLWAWLSFINTEKVWFAVIGGGAIALNLLVRPIDTAAVCAPFLIYLTIRALRQPRLLPGLVAMGVAASLGVVGTWLYNQQLTGDWRLMPMTKYFTDLNPHEKFGLGFGADMGTKIHGPEWPGYYPKDAVRVTSYRLEEFLRDFNGLPLLLLAGLLYGARRRFWNWRNQPTHLLLLLSALSLLGIYVFHFYHGIAYGSRHYYLALPAIAVLLARPLAGWLSASDARTARRARLTFAAVLLFTATLPYGQLIAEYGRNYRGTSGDLRSAVHQRGLDNAVVFVAQGGLWGWKSAFPLNTYPLENSSVIYAKDLGPENRRLMQRYPGRSFYIAHVRGRGVEIVPAGRPGTASD